ncbi:MAG: hypothetical protein OK404_02190 [Thaumarchaeota archaeon]|nr:hypothetical protein [Nitrososphaerota archaeon]
MKPKGGGRPSRSKLAIVGAIVGAVAFSIFLAYQAWTNDSFPVQQKPFADYASVQSYSFNGTEIGYQVRWLSSDYLPLFAQVTSSTTDAANTPVCGLGLRTISTGQVIPMPFAVGHPSATLTNLDLSIAVRSVATGSEFTIVYNIGSVSAQQGNVMPSGFVCQQPSGHM